MIKQFINGEWIESIDKNEIDLINPATEEIIKRLNEPILFKRK